MPQPWRHPKSGVYYVRKAVPPELRQQAGRREYKRSLGTSDLREAKRLFLEALPECEAWLDSLRVRHGAAESAGPSASFHLTPRSRDALAGQFHRYILAKYHDDPSPPEAGAVGGDPLHPLASPWTTDLEALENEITADRPAYKSPVLRDFLPGFLASEHVTLSEANMIEFAPYARSALVRALGDLQRRDNGDWRDSPTLSRYPEWTPAAPRLKLTELVDIWAAQQETPRPKTRALFGRHAGEFAAFLGHDDARRVLAADARRWAQVLRERGLSVKTINDGHLVSIAALFQAAVVAERLEVNPIRGKGVGIKADKTRKVARRPYTNEEAATILTAARVRPEPSMRWIPWLAAYSGARINELSNLRGGDIRDVDGIACIAIDNDGEGRSIKSASSRREVPLHAEVIREGFLKYAATVPKGEPLFPDVKADKYGLRGANVSRAYSLWSRNHLRITDEGAVFHSWRHFMEDRLREVQAPGEIADRILGHTVQGMRGRYGKGQSLALRAKWIAELPPIPGVGAAR